MAEGDCVGGVGWRAWFWSGGADCGLHLGYECGGGEFGSFGGAVLLGYWS